MKRIQDSLSKIISKDVAKGKYDEVRPFEGPNKRWPLMAAEGLYQSTISSNFVLSCVLSGTRKEELRDDIESYQAVNIFAAIRKL